MWQKTTISADLNHQVNILVVYQALCVTLINHLKTEYSLPHYILEESIFEFQYAGLYDIDIPGEMVELYANTLGAISYIWHSTNVRAEWPPFSALPGIWLAPFFQ